MTNHKENEMSKSELLVVTGLSGAGKISGHTMFRRYWLLLC